MKTKKKCKIDGCEKLHSRKGLCNMHYIRVRNGITDMRIGRLPKIGTDGTRHKGICSLDNCSNTHYAKGFCQNHYALNRLNGEPTKLKYMKRDKCSVYMCNNFATVQSHLCKFHGKRKCRGIDLNRPKGNSGKLNIRWNGGTSEYQNHYLLKKNRIAVLARDGNICFKCGKYTNQVHHKDHKKTDHSMENLAACCNSCNLKMAPTKTSKFIRLYGRSLSEIAKEIGKSEVQAHYLHKTGKLKTMVDGYILFRKFSLPHKGEGLLFRQF